MLIVVYTGSADKVVLIRDRHPLWFIKLPFRVMSLL
jgi:hypothetical protein